MLVLSQNACSPRHPPPRCRDLRFVKLLEAESSSRPYSSSGRRADQSRRSPYQVERGASTAKAK